MQKDITSENLITGSFFALAAFFFMALFGIFLKAAMLYDRSTLSVSTMTYISSVIFFLPVMWKKGFSTLKTRHFPYHFLRAAFGLGASFLYTYAVQFISLVNATLLFNSSPLFIPLFARFLLKEKMTKSIALAIFIGFIGIACIIKPTKEIFEQPANIFGLCSGISLAVAYVYIKVLTPTDPGSSIVFYFFLIATLLQLPFYFVYGESLSMQSHMYAILAGLSSVLTQVFLVKAYSYAKAEEIGSFQYTTIVYVAIIDWIIWNVIPTWLDLFGAFLVIVAGISIIRQRRAVVPVALK